MRFANLGTLQRDARLSGLTKQLKRSSQPLLTMLPRHNKLTRALATAMVPLSSQATATVLQWPTAMAATVLQWPTTTAATERQLTTTAATASNMVTVAPATALIRQPTIEVCFCKSI